MKGSEKVAALSAHLFQKPSYISAEFTTQTSPPGFQAAFVAGPQARAPSGSSIRAQSVLSIPEGDRRPQQDWGRGVRGSCLGQHRVPVPSAHRLGWTREQEPPETAPIGRSE